MFLRFRNQVNATGVQARSNYESATSRPISYYQVLVSRLAFVIVFEVMCNQVLDHAKIGIVCKKEHNTASKITLALKCLTIKYSVP